MQACSRKRIFELVISTSEGRAHQMGESSMLSQGAQVSDLAKKLPVAFFVHQITWSTDAVGCASPVLSVRWCCCTSNFSSCDGVQNCTQVGKGKTVRTPFAGESLRVQARQQKAARSSIDVQAAIATQRLKAPRPSPVRLGTQKIAAKGKKGGTQPLKPLVPSGTQIKKVTIF